LHENKKYTAVIENKSKKEIKKEKKKRSKERRVLISVMMAIRWRLKSNESEVWSYHRGANAYWDFVVY